MCHSGSNAIARRGAFSRLLSWRLRGARHLPGPHRTTKLSTTAESGKRARRAAARAASIGAENIG